MGCFDVYCPLCGLPMNTALYNFDAIGYSKNWKYLYDCTLLLKSNEIIHLSLKNNKVTWAQLGSSSVNSIFSISSISLS